MKRRFLPIRLIRVIRGCFSQGQKLPGRWWRAEDRAIGSSKRHSHSAKQYIRPVFMFGHLSGNRIPDVLIAWNESDRGSDGEIVEISIPFSSLTEAVLNVSRLNTVSLSHC